MSTNTHLQADVRKTPTPCPSYTALRKAFDADLPEEALSAGLHATDLEIVIRCERETHRAGSQHRADLGNGVMVTWPWAAPSADRAPH